VGSRRFFTSLVIWVSLATAHSVPALAVSGRVLNEDGQPIEGANVCAARGTTAPECVKTDGTGFYRLPDAVLTTVGVAADGYLPAKLAAVDQEAPVVLKRAASLLVRVRDAETGEALSGGIVRVVFVSGRQLDKFPFNRAGVVVGNLAPGDAMVHATLDGWTEADPPRVTLEAGKQAEAVVRLRRVP